MDNLKVANSVGTLKKPELLAPAGNLLKLKIALAYGADAVYASVGSFSLRQRSAKEFDPETFIKGVKYAQERGKKFYAATNGFPFNGQIEPLKRHLRFLNDAGVDGIIVATPGVINLCKELAPNAQIHLSTQANVLNYLDAKIYHEMGANRIVAAREMSLKDAILIKEKIPSLEIEAFCHGSMCFAYSGRCLVSAVQSGRLSNRGACANDCRFKYELYAKNPENSTLFRLDENENGTHIMNAKDLNLAAHIPEILSSGAIDSLKIEGRTKSEYYAACATGAYRAAIDDAMNGSFDSSKYERELATLKNRGFTDGYLISRPFERDDTQNHLTSIENGTHQVCAFSADGELFYCKGILRANEPYEILSPSGDGDKELVFSELVSPSGKIFSEIHSGNETPIKSPSPLAPFTFLRQKQKDKNEVC